MSNSQVFILLEKVKYKNKVTRLRKYIKYNYHLYNGFNKLKKTPREHTPKV